MKYVRERIGILLIYSRGGAHVDHGISLEFLAHMEYVPYTYSNKVLEYYIDKWYSKEKHLASYQYVMEPVKGRSMWPKTKIPPLLPPEVKKAPGRPKICR